MVELTRSARRHESSPHPSPEPARLAPRFAARALTRRRARNPRAARAPARLPRAARGQLGAAGVLGREAAHPVARRRAPRGTSRPGSAGHGEAAPHERLAAERDAVDFTDRPRRGYPPRPRSGGIRRSPLPRSWCARGRRGQFGPSCRRIPSGKRRLSQSVRSATTSQWRPWRKDCARGVAPPFPCLPPSPLSLSFL